MSEVIKTETKEVGAVKGAWDKGVEIDNDDLIIGKILMMQPTTPGVVKQQVKLGELRSSLDNSLFNEGKPYVDVIVFYHDKVWVIYEGRDWKETFAFNPSNADLPWSEMKGKVETKRQKAINLYCLVIDENFKNSLPVIIRMKSKSYNTGKQVLSLKKKLTKMDLPLASKVLRIGHGDLVTDAKGSYFSWNCTELRDSTVEEQQVAYKWFLGATKAELKVSEDDEKKGSDGAVTENDGMGDDDIPF